jgi:hypothetical protein
VAGGVIVHLNSTIDSATSQLSTNAC